MEENIGNPDSTTLWSQCWVQGMLLAACETWPEMLWDLGPRLHFRGKASLQAAKESLAIGGYQAMCSEEARVGGSKEPIPGMPVSLLAKGA